MSGSASIGTSESLGDLPIPEHLTGAVPFLSDEEWMKREEDLAVFLSRITKMFSPSPEYFRTRFLEFKILRQMLPEYFQSETAYASGLEIGCGWGFKSMLLSRYCQNLLATDIVNGERKPLGYDSSLEAAKDIVNVKFRMDNIRFEAADPAHLRFVLDDSVSFLFSEYVLEHIPLLPAAIREMYRVMEPGGVMIHVVPNSLDALSVFVNAQLESTVRGHFRALVKSFFKRETSKAKWNGISVPHCHSEFISEFADQIGIYKLENFLFPMVEAGFRIDKVVSTREFNNVIVARK